MALILRVSLFLAISISGLRAQMAGQPLTNSDIEKMLSGGLPETTILLKIEDAVDRGMVNLDASASSLVALKEKGAGERVLNQVLWAEPFQADWQERMLDLQMREAEERVAPGLPDRAGLYLQTSSGWTPVSSFLVWLPLYSGAAWINKKREFAVPMGKGQPELQISDTQPIFYARMADVAEGWQIVKTTAQKDVRQLRLNTANAFPADEDIRLSQPGDLHEVPVKHLAGEVSTLRPSAPLEPGEYVIWTAVQGGPGLKLCYRFEIRH
jgi:hypothetical protein